MRFVSFLRTTLRGLDAFDSPGMAVPFVVGFCLALKKSMERKEVISLVNTDAKMPRYITGWN